MKEFDYLNKIRVKDAYHIKEPNLPKPTDKIRKETWFEKNISRILLVLLIIYGVYLCLHPVDKIKVKSFVFGNYTMEMRWPAEGTPLVKSNIEVYRDGFRIGGTYYELEDDKFYEYKNVNGQWKRTLSSEASAGIGDAIFWEKILDSRNYELDKDHWFVWKLKDGVDTGDYSNITVKRINGCIAICFSYSNSSYSVLFKKFGITWVNKPWELYG